MNQTEPIKDNSGKLVTAQNVSFCINDEYAQCDLKDGLIEGRLRTFYKDGTLHKDLSYEKGILNGPFKIYHPNGELKIQGTHINGKPEGLMIECNETEMIKYTYKDGVLYGPFERYLFGNLTDTGFYKNGQLHGEGKSYDPINGNLLVVCNYKDGKFHGPYERFSSAGNLIEAGLYDNGTLVGPYIQYGPQGKLSIGSFENGKFVENETAFLSSLKQMPVLTKIDRQVFDHLKLVHADFLKRTRS